MPHNRDATRERERLGRRVTEPGHPPDETSDASNTAPSDQELNADSATSDAASAPAAADSETAARPATAIRFCHRCGAPWEPVWDACPHCTARAERLKAAALAGEGTGGELDSPFVRDKRDVTSATLLYFALLSVSIVTILVSLLSKNDQPGATVEFGAEIAMSAITIGWCLARWRQLVAVLLRRVRPWWLGVGVLCAVPTFLVAHLCVEGLNRLFVIKDINYLEPFRREGYGFGWAVLSVCVQPGVIEELAFRGVIFSSLQRVLGDTETLFVTALMFAILHLSVPSIPHLFFMGVVLGWLRLRSGSIVAGMLLHFTHNFLVILAEQHGSIWPW